MLRSAGSLVLVAMLVSSCDIGFDPRDLPKVRRPPGPATTLDRSERLPITYRPSREDLDEAEPADVCDLVHEPRKYDDRILRLHGFYVRGIEGPFLSGPRCAQEPGVCISYFDFREPSTLYDGTDSRMWASPFGGDEALAALNHMRVPEIEIVLTAAFHQEGSCWSGRSFLVIFRVEQVREASGTDAPPVRR